MGHWYQQLDQMAELKGSTVAFSAFFHCSSPFGQDSRKHPEASWASGEKFMIGKRKVFVTAAVCAAFGRAWAQAPQFATLDIEWENAVRYVDVVSPNPRTFMPFYGIADIVSVNGKPARGSWVLGGRLIALFPTPMPGQAIGDLGRATLVDMHLEILQADGARVGSIMTSGFTGGNAPPGLPAGFFCNLAVTGGTGA